MAGKPSMSMEAVLDEERLAVLELMEGLSNKPSRTSRGSHSSMGSGGGAAISPVNPRSPVRSMLDVVSADEVPRNASIAGTTSSGVTTAQAPIRSMLDIGPSPQKARGGASRSANTSPTEQDKAGQHNRSLSDAVTKAPAFGPRSGYKDITDDYQFSGYLQANPGGPIVPKRNTQAGKKPAGSALADSVSGSLGGVSRDRGRSVPFMGGPLAVNKSRSPHNRLGVRSASPANNSKMLVLDSGLMVDKDSAYRRMSDANLALTGGSLSTLASRKKAEQDDKGRLTKDYSYTGSEDVVESSDEPDSDERPRGRKKGSRHNSEESSKTPLGFGRGDAGPREAKTLMAAAEEERQMLENGRAKKAYKVKSLLEPEITVTRPGGTTMLKPQPRQGVHPSTAFDASGINTPHDSDTEQEISDIRRAQRLAILLTSIASKPETQRSVRTMFRGDFAKMQKDAEDEGRRPRKYLVATDLSEEAAHALEWTIGTVLRDGDTLLAIYCVDEETGVTECQAGTPTIERQAESITGSTTSLPSYNLTTIRHSITASSMHVPSPLGIGSPRGTGTPRNQSASPLSRNASGPEQERYRAVEDITERVSKLLRKTKLQVRVVIEVIHCKSPKHLICEVIDYFIPTMVILGSRGMSALKGYVDDVSSQACVVPEAPEKAKYPKPSTPASNSSSSPSIFSFIRSRL